jgi:hypothetical protein
MGRRLNCGVQSEPGDDLGEVPQAGIGDDYRRWERLGRAGLAGGVSSHVLPAEPANLRHLGQAYEVWAGLNQGGVGYFGAYTRNCGMDRVFGAADGASEVNANHAMLTNRPYGMWPEIWHSRFVRRTGNGIGETIDGTGTIAADSVCGDRCGSSPHL